MKRERRWALVLIAGLLCAVSAPAQAGPCGFELGDRVECAVDHPNGHPTLWEGMTGKIICFNYSGPWQPVLVSWDGWTHGHNNIWPCESPILWWVWNSLWWAYCHEIRPVGALPDLFDGGEAERYFTPRTVVAGRPNQPFEVGFRAWNGGNSDPEDTIYVHVYASRDTSITQSDYYLGSTNCYISAGGDVALKVKGSFPTQIPAGLYHVGWIIDPDQKIEESDETNNRARVESYRLTVAAAPANTSLELSAGTGGRISTAGEGVYTYFGSRVVQVTASPNPGCWFLGWTGTAVSAGKVADASAASTSVTVDGRYTLQAVFGGSHMLIDDFESYDPSGKPLNHTWVDGIGYLQPAPGHPGTDTGAVVDNPRTPPDAPYKVHAGRQSMEVMYDNTVVPWHSLVERSWYVFQNWTMTGADTLSLWFRGARGNAPEPLYIVVEDYSGLMAAAQHPDPQAAQVEDWTRWDIPLVQFENAGAMLSRVKRMYIRVGDEEIPTFGRTGVLYFDDITLALSGTDGAPSIPVPVAGRPVAHWSLDESSGSMAYDRVGGHHGKTYGYPTWLPSGGQTSGALRFDGMNDYVEVPHHSDFDIMSAITCAAWIKVDAFDRSWQAILTKGDIAWRIQRDADYNTIEFACTGVSVPGTVHGNVLGNTNVNDGQWHHVAGVYDGRRVSLYVDGRLDAWASGSGMIATNSYPVMIGENAQYRERYWDGLIDEVLLYNRALSADEVRSLAGLR